MAQGIRVVVPLLARRNNQHKLLAPSLPHPLSTMTRIIKTINFVMMTTMIITIINMTIIRIRTITDAPLQRKVIIKARAAARLATSGNTSQTIRAHRS
jgi:hypothetical protein